jgi:hypothetical protein
VGLVEVLRIRCDIVAAARSGCARARPDEEPNPFAVAGRRHFGFPAISIVWSTLIE